MDQQQDWRVGVPREFAKDPSYFRNINLEELRLTVLPPVSNFQDPRVIITCCIHIEPPFGVSSIVVTAPPFVVRNPSLHGLGYELDDGKNTGNFKVTLVEGNIPQCVHDSFKSIEREQVIMNRCN